MDREFAQFGKITIITGDGVGKTTLSIGIAIRRIALGKRVLLLWFNRDALEQEEVDFLEKLKTINENWIFFISDSCLDKGGMSDVREDQRHHAQSLLSIARQVMDGGRYDVLILDEINPLLSLGVIPVDDFLNFLQSKPAYLELILTGSNCSDTVLRASDEVIEIKHDL